MHLNWLSSPAYTVRRIRSVLQRRKLTILSWNGTVVGVGQVKGWPRAATISIANPDTLKPTLLIKRRGRWRAVYDVLDPATGDKLGTFRRGGFGSHLRAHWHIHDAADRPIGELVEDTLRQALLRRFWRWPILPIYEVTVGQQPTWSLEATATLRQHDVTLRPVGIPREDIDHRLGLALAVVICRIEGLPMLILTPADV